VASDVLISASGTLSLNPVRRMLELASNEVGVVHTDINTGVIQENPPGEDADAGSEEGE
jgi:hypothetical protein